MITPDANVKSFIHTVLTWKMTKTDGYGPKLCFLLCKRKVVKNSEWRKSVPILTKHSHHNPYISNALLFSSQYNIHPAWM